MDDHTTPMGLGPKAGDPARTVPATGELIEYRIRRVDRFVVSRFERDENGSGAREIGTYSSAETAYEVGYAMARADHERKGWPVGDPRIQYPEDPRCENAVPVE